MKLRALAPAKINLCLFVGQLRSDGRHELVTLFESISRADELSLTAGAGADHVVCPGVQGQNLAAAALAGLRSRGWDAPPVTVEIRKEIPVAAGLGGGSADAAATLRLAQALRPLPLPRAAIAELAASLGADVPSQLHPGVALGAGAGDEVEQVAPLVPHAFLIVPQPFGLSTAAVYREADRLGLPRSAGELRDALEELRAALARVGEWLPRALLVNDLSPAALSMRPEIEGALDAVAYAGADHALVCGSGPTVAGLYRGDDGHARALAGAAALAGRYPEAFAAVPVDAEFGAPTYA